MFKYRYDYKFLECSSDAIIPSLVNISKKVISKGYDYKRVQIMAPMYAGVNGIDNINKVLQDVFNPVELDKKEIRVGDITYRENDKVLQLVNDPDNNVFNGDIGIIKKIEYKGKSGSSEITIDYYGNLVTYKQKDFNKFKKITQNQNNNISDKMKQALRLYKDNIKYIENSFKYDINNGVIEGKNNLIKSIKRIAFGYRKYDHFVARIFLISGTIKG